MARLIFIRGRTTRPSIRRCQFSPSSIPQTFRWGLPRRHLQTSRPRRPFPRRRTAVDVCHNDCLKAFDRRAVHYVAMGGNRLGLNFVNDRRSTPGDVAQLQLSWNRAARECKIRMEARYNASVAFTHKFSKTMPITRTFRYSGASRQRLVVPLVEEATSRRRPSQFQIKIYKTSSALSRNAGDNAAFFAASP